MRAIRVNMDMQRVENFPRGLAHLLQLQEAARFQLAAQEDGVGHRQVFGEIELLVDDHDAQLFGLAMGRQLHALTVKADMA